MKFWAIIGLGAFTLGFNACGPKKIADPKFNESLYERVDVNFYKSKKDGKLFIRTGALEAVKDSGNKIVYYYKQVPDIDLASFKKLDFGGYYVKDKNHVYTWDHTTKGEEITILEGTDVNSFTCFANRWGKDKNTVYYENRPVKGLNPAEMAIVCAEMDDSTSIYIDYIRDKDQLFYHEEEIKVPAGVDIMKISCKDDLFGNPFLSYNGDLYIISNGAMVLYQ